MGNLNEICLCQTKQQEFTNNHNSYGQFRYKWMVFEMKNRRQGQYKLYLCSIGEIQKTNKADMKQQYIQLLYQKNPQDIKFNIDDNSKTRSSINSSIQFHQKRLDKEQKSFNDTTLDQSKNPSRFLDFQYFKDRNDINIRSKSYHPHVIEEQIEKERVESKNSAKQRLTNSQNVDAHNNKPQPNSAKSSMIKNSQKHSKSERSYTPGTSQLGGISQRYTVMNEQNIQKYEKQIQTQNEPSKTAFLKHRIIQGLMLNNNYSQKAQVYYSECYQFYNKNQSTYFQELINLNNSMALYYSKWNKREQAIELLNQTIALQQKYYSKLDQRHILAYNNMACEYYESNNDEKGQQYINKCKELLQKHEKSHKIDNKFRQIKQLVYNNHRFYLSRIHEADIEETNKHMLLIQRLQSKVQPN